MTVWERLENSDNPWWDIYPHDARTMDDFWASIPDESIQCVVTSPPYYGLRDYGHDGQIGLEPTPQEYVAELVKVFRGIRRVLKDDGVLWLNLGDSYNSNTRWSGGGESAQAGNTRAITDTRRMGIISGLKGKDLIGIPWRVAFALQADGWYLRQDIIWSKPNPMPESVKDRCTKSHEYLFLLTKSPRYYYNAEAIAEPLAVTNAQRTTNGYNTAERYGAGNGGNSGLDSLAARMRAGDVSTRNRRSVWSIATQPYKGAHFAVMPKALVEPCILAGSRPGDTVLDPFMGSGTVLEVATMLGRKSIGFEINEAYIDLALDRLTSMPLPLPLIPVEGERL